MTSEPMEIAMCLLKGQESKEFFEQYPDISYYQEDVIQHPPDYSPYEQEADYSPDELQESRDAGHLGEWGPAPGESEVMGGSRLSGRQRPDYIHPDDRTAFSRTTMNPQMAAILARYARKLPGTAKHPRITYMRDVLSDTPEEPENRATYAEHLADSGFFTTGEPMEIAMRLLKGQT